MAVQAQQHNPLSTASFANDFHTDESRQIATILDQYRNQEIQQQVQHKTMLNGTLQMVLSSDPDSDLTCNLSGSRKRPRDIHQVATNSTQFLLQQQQQQQQQMLLANRLQIGGAGFLPAVKPAMLPQKIAATTDDSRFIQSTMTSTSGRLLVSATAAPVPSTSTDLIAQQNGEIEALIQFQTKKLRYDLEEMRKRHWCTIVSAMEQQLQYLLKAKQAELDSVSKKNTELEEKVKQMAAENRIWFQMAKNSETLVMGLRSSLEQALMQNVAIPNNDNAIVEGFGDSEDDAQSCCYNTEVEKARRKVEEQRLVQQQQQEEEEKQGKAGRRACKVCVEGEACVLVLPCRHLCLCRGCESKVDACPVCRSAKNASLQVFMS